MIKQNRRNFLKYSAICLTASNFPFLNMLIAAGNRDNEKPDVRALLIHITHYDPKWNSSKEFEGLFSVESALAIIEKMTEVDLNMLVVDIADGIEYKSHPALKRHYSVPMKDLEVIAKTAHEKNIEFVPKLNFSKSGRNHHDMWMKPYWHGIGWTRDMDKYWKVAGELIDELVEVCTPKSYFHIGMDEDHYRSLSQYVDAINRLHSKISNHNLRPVMWNDTCYLDRNVVAQVYADKMRAAESLIPKDIVQVLWDYDIVHKGLVEHLVKMGFTVWVAPGRESDHVLEWKKILLREGGQGLFMTSWIKCNQANKDRILKQIEKQGPLYN
jgi:hypothetical protein